MAKLWGTRFKGNSDLLADQFSCSITYDFRLAKYDVIGSIAHAEMLAKQKIIPSSDAAKIVSGLKKILSQIEKGTFKTNPKAEDVHSHVQDVLKKMIGDSADKLHTGRSRNDLIALDVRMYCKDEISLLVELISLVQKAIVKFAQKNHSVIIPAFTHLQRAQVVLLAHHMLAYVEMLERDKERLLDAYKRTDVMPLGSAALSGTSLPIDRLSVAKKLGFAKVSNNSMDSVSDRDFVIELLSAIALLGVHFSRVAEELIILSTQEFGYFEIDWSLCTGSSIMPHKKNPDILELIRGESAKLISNLNEVLVLMKGLPLTYNRDMQLDKTPLFEAADKAELILQLMEKVFISLKLGNAKTLQDQSFFSVDAMEYLIKKGVSYREAHDTIGKMVKNIFDYQKLVADMNVKELKAYHPKFESDVKHLFNPKMSVKIKKSHGSTNPTLVQQQLKKWASKLHA
jgi:argininosuccinate lyase